jgi:hypothetical protein
MVSEMSIMKTRRLLAKQSGVRSTFIGHSDKFGHATIKESSLELDYFNWMVFTLPAEVEFIMQPPKHYYQLNGKDTHYTADGHITYPSGKIYVDEVKYKEDADEPATAYKHSVLKEEYSKLENTTFRVLTEHDIRVGERSENFKMLKPCLKHQPPVKALEALLSNVKQSQLSLVELFDIADKQKIDRGVIKNAVAHQLLRADLTVAWKDLVFTL